MCMCVCVWVCVCVRVLPFQKCPSEIWALFCSNAVMKPSALFFFFFFFYQERASVGCGHLLGALPSPCIPKI